MPERSRVPQAEATPQGEPAAAPQAVSGHSAPAVSNRAITRSLEAGRLDPALIGVLSHAVGHPVRSPSISWASRPGQGAWATGSHISLDRALGDQADVLAHEAIHVAQFSRTGPASSAAAVEAEADEGAARLNHGRPLPPIRHRATSRAGYNAEVLGNILGLTVKEVISRRDGDLVTYLSNAELAATSWAEWRALIDEIHYLGWVSNRNERDLERLWGTLSADQLLDRPGEDLERWKTGVDRGADLYEIPAMRQLERDFAADVRAESLRCLRANRALVAGDLDAFGVTTELTPGETTTAEQEDNLAALQDLAIDVMQLQQAMEELRDVKVGYSVDFEFLGGKYPVRHYHVATYDPGGRPALDHDGAGLLAPVPAHVKTDGLATWDSVDAVYRPLKARFESLKADTPALYALLEYGEGDALSDLATAGPAAARSLLGRVLGHVDAKAVEAIDKVSTGDLDPLDIIAIHRRLLSGDATPSSDRAWSSEAGRAVAVEIVRGHEEAEFWTMLGLATLAAAAFVVVELATFGTATFFIAAGVGLGLTGYQVGSAWEHYDDLADVSQATYDVDNAVVSRAQVEAARTAAIVETAFGFLDALGPAAKGLKSVAAGRRAAPIADAGAEVLEETGEAAAERTAREVGEGAAETTGHELGEVAAEAGTGAAATATASNLEQVRALVGTSIDDLAEPPAGYRFFERNGKRFIRRIDADDARFVKLSRDPSGLIVLAGRAGSAASHMMPLASISRPITLVDAMITAAMDQLGAMPGLLRRKLGSFTGPVDGAVNSGHFGNLKGNVGEILGRTARDEELEWVRQMAPDAQAFDSVKARYTSGDGTVRTVEFTDGIIASKRGGGLQVHNVVEVKARPKGGANAQSQIHRWIEDRLEDGFELIVDGDVYTYMPGVPISNPVVGLARAPRTIIAPRTAETLGLGMAEQIAPSVTRRALDYSDAELRYLVRLVIEELL